MKKKFLSVINNVDVYTCLFSSGILVAPKQVNNSWLYIIGLDISYDTIDWLLYNKFTIIPLSEHHIISVYRSLKGEDKLKKKLNQQLTVHNLLHEILLCVKHWERAKLLTNYFNIKTIKQYSTNEICKLVDFQIEDTGYKHIDINTGLRFNGEITYDINGNPIN